MIYYHDLMSGKLIVFRSKSLLNETIFMLDVKQHTCDYRKFLPLIIIGGDMTMIHDDMSGALFY